ncbi:hypothetical protein ACFVS2_22075 [Brevibacillus sp. NPDC058079]|uniref:hypothetical protein n=1 Tax=Brevibacillus sp. NPDC058079 TaxID=3346330 RepID=UPI0036EF04C8
MEKQGYTQQELEAIFLQDTIDILYGYDGCNSIDSLKDLIDETRVRLIKLKKGQVNKVDLGIDE